MKRVARTTAFFATLMMLFASLSLSATEQGKTDELSGPGQIIDSVTGSVLTLASEKKTLFEEDPAAYFEELRATLEPVIDFESIAKNVMGRKSWLSIDEEQQARFVDVFTNSLVQTYGKAMLSFADLDVKVVKTWPSDNPQNKSYYVQQEVKLESGLSHIVYSMHPIADGWKVRNVTIRDSKGFQLNMGKTFYSQFQHSLSENKDDVIATIDAWGKQ